MGECTETQPRVPNAETPQTSRYAGAPKQSDKLRVPESGNNGESGGNGKSWEESNRCPKRQASDYQRPQA